MILAEGEGSEPHVQVVPSLVDPVQQVGHHTRVTGVFRENVYVTRISRYLDTCMYIQY